MTLPNPSFTYVLHRKLHRFNKKIPVLESLFDKATDLKACNFIKKKFQHRCFPVKCAKFVRTPFFYRTSPVAASDFNLFFTLSC